MCLRWCGWWLDERESVCIAAAFATCCLYVHRLIVIVRQALCLSAGCVVCVYKLLANSRSEEWWVGCWWQKKIVDSA